MAAGTKIEWAHATWNVVVGSQVQWTGKVAFDDAALLKPLSWKNPKRIFVASMGDPNHKNVSDLMRDKMLAIVAEAEQHDFLWLTKRPADMARYYKSFGDNDAEDRGMMFAAWCIGTLGQEAFERILAKKMWRGLLNLWVGTSVENADQHHRIDELREVPAAVRFLSCEPLLGDLGKVDLNGIHWVIAGGESGRKARPMHPDWVRSLRDQCKDAGVPFFFKQWGEWAPGAVYYAADRDERGKWDDVVNPDGTTGAGAISESSGICSNFTVGVQDGFACVRRVGKKAASHLLDGVEHHAFPITPNDYRKANPAVERVVVSPKW